MSKQEFNPGDIVFTGGGHTEGFKFSIVVPPDFWDKHANKRANEFLKTLNEKNPPGHFIKVLEYGYNFHGGVDFQYRFIQANFTRRLASIFDDEEMKTFNQFFSIATNFSGYVAGVYGHIFMCRKHLLPEPAFARHDITDFIQALYGWHKANVVVNT